MRTRHLTLVTATVALTAIAGPALAHTTANPSTTAAGAYAVIDLRVPHGCDGQATEVLEVAIPAGVVSVKPEDVPGWDAEAELGEYEEPVTLHGEEITEGVVAVTWTAQDGEELADTQYRDFGLSVKLPDAAGETLYFPAVQTCVDGSEAAWIEIPSEDGEQLEAPAPAITLTASEAHGHGDSSGGDTEEATGTDGEVEEAADDGVALDTVAAASVAEGTDQGTAPVTWLALAVGLLGLAVGTAGLLAARRR